MSKIHVLDEKTAGKIAAGEVIERPAGVLKELLENAVDAGASAINIDIEGAGRTLIRINHNGCGMSEDDLLLSIQRHATSKINSFSDLETLQTFGFRGEALYSVAAVSRMAITSCREGGQGHEMAHSTRIVGIAKEVSEIALRQHERVSLCELVCSRLGDAHDIRIRQLSHPSSP